MYTLDRQLLVIFLCLHVFASPYESGSLENFSKLCRGRLPKILGQVPSFSNLVQPSFTRSSRPAFPVGLGQRLETVRNWQRNWTILFNFQMSYTTYKVIWRSPQIFRHHSTRRTRWRVVSVWLVDSEAQMNSQFWGNQDCDQTVRGAPVTCPAVWPIFKARL